MSAATEPGAPASAAGAATPSAARPALDAADRAALVAAAGSPAVVRFDEPMARHTTLRMGGPVDAWAEPDSIAALQQIRRLCRDRAWPCRAVGSGSNLLVRDGGVRGVLVSTSRLRPLRFDGARVVVGAGVSTGKLLSEATRRELSGVEFLGGVPGSVGGGMMMNAGTYLGEFKDVTLAVRTVNAAGDLIERSAEACGFAYRGSAIPAEEVVVEADLVLAHRPRAAIDEDVRALRERRRAREPHGVANAGSTFKNPPGDYAGRLIEACGLKGSRRGAAQISPAHANWIVNTGGATARDFLALVDLARDAVERRFGVTLELELKVVGES